MKKFIAVLSILLSGLAGFAQVVGDTAPSGLRADGKIYVVGAVVLTILIGLFFYIIRIDRKLSKLEKDQSL